MFEDNDEGSVICYWKEMVPQILIVNLLAEWTNLNSRNASVLCGASDLYQWKYFVSALSDTNCRILKGCWKECFGK